MNRKKPYIYKRVIAYVIDLLVVTLLSGILTGVITDSNQYNADSQRLVELTQRLATNEISQEDFYKEYDEINYDLTKDSINVTVITITVTLVYYVIMMYFCHGITLGKFITKIKIVSANGKDLNIFNYLLRSLIVNNVLSNTVTLVLVTVLTKESFISVYPKVSNAFTLLIVATFMFMSFREDGRGLHDLIGNTKVINFKDEEIKDAEIEKEVVKNK